MEERAINNEPSMCRCRDSEAGFEGRNRLMRQLLPLSTTYYDFVEGVKGDKGQDEK